MKRELYAEVSARIIAELEAGAAPWVKPWSASPGANTPCNAVSNRPYSGCNVVLLWMAQAAGYRTPRFLTFKQALELGGNVRKGERGTKVYFVKQLQFQAAVSLLAVDRSEMADWEPHRSILRDAMIETFVRQRFVEPDEWFEKVPGYLRQGTNPIEKTRYLDQICDIVGRLNDGENLTTRADRRRSAGQ
jgi:hypothetical protein